MDLSEEYGHVAILRGYQQDTTSEILGTYPQDTKGTVVAAFDEQNAGKMIDDPITDRFGLVTRRQLPASDFNRNSLVFKGLILPRRVQPKLSISTDSKTFWIGTDATMPVVTATVSCIPPWTSPAQPLIGRRHCVPEEARDQRHQKYRS